MLIITSIRVFAFIVILSIDTIVHIYIAEDDSDNVHVVEFTYIYLYFFFNSLRRESLHA